MQLQCVKRQVKIGILKEFFIGTWMKENARKYFEERDPKALPYLNEFMALPNMREAMGYSET